MINKLPTGPKIEKEPQRSYELTLRDVKTGEILYQNKGYAGALCFMEQLTSYSQDVEGNHQIALWGNPMLQVYCVDQLQQSMQKIAPEILEELKSQGFILTNLTPDDLKQK